MSKYTVAYNMGARQPEPDQSKPFSTQSVNIVASLVYYVQSRSSTEFIVLVNMFSSTDCHWSCWSWCCWGRLSSCSKSTTSHTTHRHVKLFHRRTVRWLVCATNGGRLWTAVGRNQQLDNGSNTNCVVLSNTSTLAMLCIHWRVRKHDCFVCSTVRELQASVRVTCYRKSDRENRPNIRGPN